MKKIMCAVFLMCVAASFFVMAETLSICYKVSIPVSCSYMNNDFETDEFQFTFEKEYTGIGTTENNCRINAENQASFEAQKEGISRIKNKSNFFKSAKVSLGQKSSSRQ